MSKYKIFAASIFLTLVSLAPGVALADIDELDVTMEVLDSVADINGEVMQMRGPDGDGEDAFDEDEGDGEGAGEDGVAAGDGDEISDEEVNQYFAEQAEREGDFEGDDDFSSLQDAEELEDEGNFDDDENIDDDEPDPVEPAEDDMESEDAAGDDGDAA